jgi:hypothetical protein
MERVGAAGVADATGAGAAGVAATGVDRSDGAACAPLLPLA